MILELCTIWSIQADTRGCMQLLHLQLPYQLGLLLDSTLKTLAKWNYLTTLLILMSCRVRGPGVKVAPSTKYFKKTKMQQVTKKKTIVAWCSGKNEIFCAKTSVTIILNKKQQYDSFQRMNYVNSIHKQEFKRILQHLRTCQEDELPFSSIAIKSVPI